MAAAFKTAPRALAPLALMAAIFALSAQPGLSTELGLIDLIGRKIAHIASFGTLTALWWWALLPAAGQPAAGRSAGKLTGAGRDAAGGPGAPDRRSGAGRAALIGAAAISFVYAVTDEYHQSFVEDRVGSPIDVGIDTAGIAIACWLIATGRLQRWVVAAQRILLRSRR